MPSSAPKREVAQASPEAAPPGRVGRALRTGAVAGVVSGAVVGTATFLLYAALGLGSITVVAPLVAVFPLMAVVMSYLLLRGERLHIVGLLGIVVSVAGVIVLLVAG